MLFPNSHAWTLPQKWLIVSAAAVALVLSVEGIYTYERYHRQPINAAFFGTIHASDNSDEVFYEEIPEHQPEWKFAPRAAPRPRQEVNSDYDYEQWRFKFLSASDKPQGSAGDMAAIRCLVPATIPPTIRWVSRHVAVVASACQSDVSPSPRIRCLYVFEKHGSKWKLTHHYRFPELFWLAPDSGR